MEKTHPCNTCKAKDCDGCIWDARYNNCCSYFECIFYRDYCTLGFADQCKLSDEFVGDEEDE